MSEPQITKSDVKPPPEIYRVVSLLQTGPYALGLRFIDQAYRLITGASWKFTSKITPFLWVGGQQRRRGWDTMKAQGITASINMRELIHDDVKNMIVTDKHLHLDTVDNTPVTLEKLHQAADFIDLERATGGTVYVHCGVGVGRAPSAAASYFIKYENMTAEESLNRIKENRPFIHLTAKQIAQLEKFYEDVQSS